MHFQATPIVERNSRACKKFGALDSIQCRIPCKCTLVDQVIFPHPEEQGDGCVQGIGAGEGLTSKKRLLLEARAVETVSKIFYR